MSWKRSGRPGQCDTHLRFLLVWDGTRKEKKRMAVTMKQLREECYSYDVDRWRECRDVEMPREREKRRCRI